MKNSTLIFLAILICLACNSNKIEIINHCEGAIEKKQEIRYSKLADSLKMLVTKAEEFCLWYVDNLEDLNKDEIVVYNDSLGYYQFNDQVADSFIIQIENSELFSHSFIEINKDILSELEKTINSKPITDKDDTYITDFTDYDAFYNNYEVTVPDKDNVIDLKPINIEIFEDNITIMFYPDIPVCFALDEGENKWLVTYAD